MHRLYIALLAAAALMFATVPTVAAQESTASPTPLDAAECTTEPISFEALTGTLATPAAEMTAPEASPTPVTAPDGEPADDDTAAAVEETITQLTACLNAGDLLSTLALYSDGFIQNAFSQLEITQEIYDEQLAVVEPRAEGEQVLLFSFGDVVITDDGRAAVVVVGDDLANEGEPSGTLFYLVEQDGTWLVDETAGDVQMDES
jgi:hypothetical protein